MESIEIREPYPIKSTTDRSCSLCPAPVRWGFGALRLAHRPSAERLAAWLFCHPVRVGVLPEDAAVLDEGHPFRLRAEGHDLAAWSWGDGPTVLLHHGWSGRGAHMVRFVRPLLDAGYSVVTYDAPAHGESPGRITAMPEMARILRDVAWQLNGLTAVVAHSIGAAATLYALRTGLKLDRAVVLAPPSDLRGFIDLFGEHLGLDERTRDGMARVAAGWFRIDWRQMDVDYWAETDRPPLLVVHDREDAVIPWSHGERIHAAWTGAELMTTHGLGHRGVRLDPGVVDRVVSFLG